MNSILLQMLPLLLVAYFAGAFLACIIRRTFFPHTLDHGADAALATGYGPAAGAAAAATAQAPQRRPEPSPVAARSTTSEPAQRFERALSGQGSTPPSPAASAPVAAPAPRAPAPTAPAPVVAPPRVVASTPVFPAPAATAAPATAAPAAAPNAPRAATVSAPAPAAAAAPSTPAPSSMPPKAAQPTPTPLTPPPASPVVLPAAAAAASAAAAAATAAALAQKVQASAPAAAATAPAAVLQQLPTAAGTSGPATVAAPIAPSAPIQQTSAKPAPAAAAPGAAGPSDLTRIRAIDGEMQRQLDALGVRSFGEIANWKPQDVARVAAALKIPGRIEQENWIEQAQILDKGGETYYSRRKAKGELPTSRPTPNEGERTTIRVQAPSLTTPAAPAAPAVVSPPAATPTATAAAATTAATAVRVAQAAVTAATTTPTTATPAAPTPAPTATAPAAVVKAGVASAATAGATIATVASAAASAAAAAAGATAPAVADRAAFAGGSKQASATPAVTPTASPTAPTIGDRPIGMARDQLQRIGGINAEVERLLNVQGVTKYSQIAGWGSADIARFDRLLGFEGRIARENWIEQSQILANGGETAYSREIDRRTRDGGKIATNDASRETGKDASAKGGLSSLRSVRSEAYRPADSAAVAVSSGRGSQDLKRIRGVGVLIEKKLNSLGVTRYDQVANWTQADIERFSDKLDFKGRIERENWVEQARILSAGGQTEFSRRVDRGEVETSKPK